GLRRPAARPWAESCGVGRSDRASRTCLGVFRQLRPQAGALFHVDDVAVLGEAVDQGCRQVIVLQKRTPFAKSQGGSDQRGFLWCRRCKRVKNKPTCSGSTSTYPISSTSKRS